MSEQAENAPVQWESAGAGSLPASLLDLHCHILPSLDDGARDGEDSVAMALQGQADGIAAICATPHIRDDHDVRIHELPERLERLAQSLRAAGSSVRVLPGAEVAAPALGGLSDGDLRELSLGGGGRWLLLEPPSGPLDERFERAADELHDRGLCAVIAHPERHGAPDLLRRLEKLVEQGALIQATAAFFLHDTTRETMLDLARHGMVHVLGSDAHSSHGGRPVALAAGYEALATVEPAASHLEWITVTAPWAIVNGEELTPPF